MIMLIQVNVLLVILGKIIQFLVFFRVSPKIRILHVNSTYRTRIGPVPRNRGVFSRKRYVFLRTKLRIISVILRISQ